MSVIGVAINGLAEKKNQRHVLIRIADHHIGIKKEFADSSPTFPTSITFSII